VSPAVCYQRNSMKTSVLAWRVLAIGVMTLSFCIAVYRAKVQSIGHDEAEEYVWFLSSGAHGVLEYNPANHVLFTLLAKPTVWVFGVSEFTLRAPSLVGAALYLIVTYLLCRRLFGEGALFFFSVAMLCLNPQIVDFMGAARGYILGLGFLLGGLYVLVRLASRGKFGPDDKTWLWGCAVASVLLALSLVANFSNVVPVAALMLCFSAFALGGFAALAKLRDHTLHTFARFFVAPGVVVGFCLLWPYLIQVRFGQYKMNMDRGSDSLRDVFTSSFLYKWTDDMYAHSLGAVAPLPGSWQQLTINLGIYILLPCLFLFVLVGLILLSRVRSEPETIYSISCRIIAGAAVTSVALIVLLHVLAGLDYPLSRYCLYLVPLFTLSGLLVGQELSRRFPRPYFKMVGFLVCALVTCDYGLSLQTTRFRYNAYDVISRTLFQTIASDAQARGLVNVRAGGTWWYDPELNFYRRRYKADWMKPYDVKDRSYFWESPNALEPGEYDYYVFTPENDPGLAGARTRTIFQDRTTRLTVLAIENPRPRTSPGTATKPVR